MSTDVPVSTKVAELQAAKDLLVEQRLAREISLAEAANVRAENDRIVAEEFMFNSQRMVDPWDSIPPEFRGNNYWGGIAPYQSSSSDTHKGLYQPFITSESDLSNSRAMARFVSTVNCPAIGIIENLQNYIIGPGFNFAAGTKKNSQAPDGLVAAVQDVVDEFLDDNDFNGDLDRELLWRSARDGEFFLTVYAAPNRTGRTILRTIEPEQVTDCLTGSERSEAEAECPCATNWTLGIHTPDHDVQQVLGYAVEWGSGDHEYIPAKYVTHYKRNVTRSVKRGLSDFFPAWKWLQLQEKLLTNTAEGAAKLAAISFIIEYAEGHTQQQVHNLLSTISAFQTTISTPRGGNNTYYQNHLPPGTTLNVPRGQSYKPGPTGHERGSAFLEVVDGILRIVGSRFCMTSAMLTGDDSQTNFASAVAAGSRFHRYAVCRQSSMVSVFSKIVWKAIEFAYNAGRFRKFGYAPGAKSWRELMRVAEVAIDPPDVDAQNKVEDSTVRTQQHAAGILSKKTWREQCGLDHETEEANIASERARDPQ